MFVIKAVPEITVPVDIHVPGETAVSRVYATWKLHSFDDAQDKIKAIQLNQVTDDSVVNDDLISLSELYDEQGKPVAYSSDVAKQLLQITYVRIPLMNSWFAAQQGRSEAAEKN